MSLVIDVRRMMCTACRRQMLERVGRRRPCSGCAAHEDFLMSDEARVRVVRRSGAMDAGAASVDAPDTAPSSRGEEAVSRRDAAVVAIGSTNEAEHGSPQ